MVALEGESVQPRFEAKAMTSDEVEKKRSCWAEAIGSDVYELTNESAISFLSGQRKRQRRDAAWSEDSWDEPDAADETLGKDAEPSALLLHQPTGHPPDLVVAALHQAPFKLDDLLDGGPLELCWRKRLEQRVEGRDARSREE